MKKIPPFIDHHIHFFIDGQEVNATDTATAIINPMRQCGILMCHDMGSKGAVGVEVKERLVGIKTAGAALCKKGGYGAFLGVEVDGKEEVLEAVRWNVAKGADFIKVVNSGIVTGNPDRPVSAGGFSLYELRLIVDEAGALGRPVRCHANSEEAIKDAILAGVSTIEHGFFISEESLHIMAERDVVWIPTIFALKAYAMTVNDRKRRTYLDSVIDGHMQSVYKAQSIGVTIKAGSDSGAKGMHHGKAFLEELKMLRSAGLSTEETIRAGTMGFEEIDRGNYLIVDNDFPDTCKIEAFAKAFQEQIGLAKA